MGWQSGRTKRHAELRQDPASSPTQVAHATGRFAYVSNRGHDSIAAFALAADGKLSAIGQFPTEKTPRSFGIDPSGKYLFAAGESSGKLAGYRIDAKSGELTRFATQDVGTMPWWVMAVEMPR